MRSRCVDPARVRVILLDTVDAVRPRFPESLRRRAHATCGVSEWRRIGLEDLRPHYLYVRQLWDSKISADISGMRPSDMARYARLCAWTLARAHARSGDSVAIAGYLGSSQVFDRAIAQFAEAYADQNERDYAMLIDAIATRRVQAQSEL